MGSYRSGQNGEMFIRTGDISDIIKTQDGNQVMPIRDWNINFTQDILDTTCLADKDKTYFGGNRSFSGGGTLLYYERDPENTNPSTFGRLMSALISPATTGSDKPENLYWGRRAASPPTMVRINLRSRALGAADTDAEDLNFYAFITGFQITCSVGEIMTGNFTFQGHGPVINNTF